MITPAYSPTATERVLPRMALDFTTASLDSRVTVTRALNTATRVNNSGLVASVNADLPRFDFDPVTLTCKGLLIEESRANIPLYSEDIGQAYWTKGNATVLTDAVVSPSGTTTADKIVESLDVSGQLHYFTRTALITNGQPYAASIFAKAGERTQIAIQLGNVLTYFNLSSGTIVSGTGTIQSFGNGWYRCIVTTAAAANGTYAFYTALNGAASYTGDGTSGLYVWGAQLEAGAFATSYIPTTTTSLTRNADAVSMTGTNFSSWYNATEGTLFAEASTFSNDVTADKFVANINNNGFPNRILMNFNAVNNFSASVVSNSVSQVSGANGSSAALNTPIKMCFATKLDSFAWSQSGVAPSTDALGNMPVTVDRLWIGGANTTAFLNGHMRQIKFWPQRLTNAEVQAFSK